MIKEKTVKYSNECLFKEKVRRTLPVTTETRSFLSLTKSIKHWSCQNMYGAFTYILDNILIRFSTKLCRQIVGIPIGTKCAPLIADILLCYERYFMPFFTRRACATACSGRSDLLCFFRILITPKRVVLREYFDWNVSYFGRDLYRND